jgi:hypothetical protein
MGAPTCICTSNSLIGASDSLIGDSGRPTGETAELEGTYPAFPLGTVVRQECPAACVVHQIMH